MNERHPVQHIRAADQRRAFTIVELIVSMGILTATMIAVATIFSISSDAAGRTEAHAEILEASAAFQQTVVDELSRIVPEGLLIIESPPPTLVRAEVPDGPRMFRLRHDRLVFLTSKGTEGAYQSFTDPTRGEPGPTDVETRRTPASSAEALVYYGPGIPVVGNGTATGIRKPFDVEAIGLTASEWMFAHRAILLMLDPPNPAIPGWTPPDMTAFDTGLLTNSPAIFEGWMDALVSSAADRATPATLAAKLAGLSLATPPARLSDLWQPNLTPVTTSLTDSTDADYFTRSGFTFQPRMVDFRIEWTDGRRVDPNGPDNDPATAADNNWATRWFGLAPDTAQLPDLSNLDGMDYQARTRFPAAGNPSNPNTSLTNPDNPAAESFYFTDPTLGNGIEWAQFGSTPNAAARYRAVWGRDTWQYRPKALRFTYRIYDATRRLKQPTTVDFNEDGVADLDGASNKFIVTRYGQEFSIVVALP